MPPRTKYASNPVTLRRKIEPCEPCGVQARKHHALETKACHGTVK